jgi:hypothetical protein
MLSASDSLFGSFFSWSNAQGETPHSPENDPPSLASDGDAPGSPEPAPDDDDLRQVKDRLRNGFYHSERIRSFIARCLSFDLVPYAPDPASPPDDPERPE